MLQLLKTSNFGSSRLNATGSSGVGYTILDDMGIIVTPRTTASIYQSAPGIYSANVSFPDDFHGQIIWDTGSAFSDVSYATEQYNVEENNPKVNEVWSMVSSTTGSIQLIRDMTEGRWKISANKMQFFKADNITLIAEFDLFDDVGVPSMDAVFERSRI